MKSADLPKSGLSRDAESALGPLAEQARQYAALSWFLELLRSHFAPEREAKRVALLGPHFPEELIYAAGAVPYWIMGGSARAAALADEEVPRDTDPVSRAMLGCFRDPGMAWLREVPVLIPVTNDSGRKLAWLLRRDGYQVHTVDFPPSQGPEAVRAWASQMERCADVLSSYTKKRPSRAGVRRASRTLSQCREQALRFLPLADGLPELRMAVLFSYYCASDPAQWCKRLSLLCGELEECGTPQADDSRPRVLLTGSPVYFPNRKLPLLLREAGLHTAMYLDGSVQKLLTRTESADPVSAFFAADCSGAGAVNRRMLAFAERAMSELSLDGVVFHVLKGQIEYDFELPRLERLAERYGLPVIRLETDYNPQDVEQLRVRLEAFGEMLIQERRRKGRGAQ